MIDGILAGHFIATIAALLKAAGGPIPARTVRILADKVGGRRSAWDDEVDGPAWMYAVAQLRGHGQLVEDLAAGTWAPGPGIEDYFTEPLDARAARALATHRRRAK